MAGLFERLNLIQDCTWMILLLFNHSTCSYGAKFCKAIVTAVLHHFCVPVTLQSQNIIKVNKPIKMMANFEMKFTTSVPKALLCWQFDSELRRFQGLCNKTSTYWEWKINVRYCHQIESLKNFNKTYSTWLIVVLYILKRP